MATTRVSTRLTTRQRLLLLVLLGSGFLMSVDFSILNVALLQAGAGVGLGPAGLPWIAQSSKCFVRPSCTQSAIRMNPSTPPTSSRTATSTCIPCPPAQSIMSRRSRPVATVTCRRTASVWSAS